MKKAIILCLALALAIVWGIGSAFAGPVPGDGKKIFQFNLIGVPKKTDLKNDDANGRAILIPLKNVTSRAAAGMVCDIQGNVQVINDTEPTYDMIPAGTTKLYWEVKSGIDNFEIADRDALDGSAKIYVPANLLDPSTDEIKFDVWLRVLGKPRTGCMNINAYAYDSAQNLYFWSGSVYINRKTGKSTFTSVNDLFKVWYCEVDQNRYLQDGVTPNPNYMLCLDGSTNEISVFADVFANYFWDILNDGTRLVQVRISVN